MSSSTSQHSASVQSVGLKPVTSQIGVKHFTGCSVVECLSQAGGVVGLSLTATL